MTDEERIKINDEILRNVLKAREAMIMATAMPLEIVWWLFLVTIFGILTLGGFIIAIIFRATGHA